MARLSQQGICKGEWSPNGIMIRNSKGKSVLVQARQIAVSLGTFKAARYMARRGWSIEAALWTLCHSERSRVNVQGMGD